MFRWVREQDAIAGSRMIPEWVQGELLKMGRGALENGLRTVVTRATTDLFQKWIPELRATIVARITPEPPPSFHAALIRRGLNINVDRARIFWDAAFEALCNVEIDDPLPSPAVAASEGSDAV